MSFSRNAMLEGFVAESVGAFAVLPDPVILSAAATKSKDPYSKHAVASVRKNPSSVDTLMAH
jgi:hypothetical protein